MPKPMTITISVEEAFFGKIYRTLDLTPGVVSISYHSESEAKPKPKPNGKSRPSYDTIGKDFVIKLLSKGRPMIPSAVGKAFTSAGRSYHSATSVIHKLKSEGLIQNIEGKGYTLTTKMKGRLRHRKGVAE
jgi:predicted transcriptional regulator